MKIEIVCSIIACAVTVGGVLIFIGRSLGQLREIGEGVRIALSKTDRHDLEIARIDKELTEVKTRQVDCAHCP